MERLLARLLDAESRRRWMLLIATLAVLFPVSKAAAQATVDTHVPFSGSAVNPCTGEPFAGSGFVHIKIFESFDPNYHVSMEANVESFEGITVTGVRYVVPEQLSSHTIADTDALPANGTDEEVAHLIRQAEDGSFVAGDDFYVKISAHFTYNGNGDLTSSFDDLTTECR